MIQETYKLCPSPWRALSLSTSGYGPCCLYRLTGETYSYPNTASDLLTLFNSTEMKRIRRRLAEGRVVGTPCEKCLDRKKEFLPIVVSDEFRETLLYAKYLDAFENRRIELDYTPIELSVATSPKCNLRCIMCSSNDQNIDSDVYNRNFFPSQEFRTMLNGCEGIGRLSFSGGEPFLDEDFLKILKHLIERYKTCTIRITTNGFYLKKYMDLISKIKNLDLMVSIDGFKESYEKIRKGGTWKVLTENLRVLRKKAETKKLWKIQINSIIMKTSLPDFDKLIKYVNDLGFTHQFSPLRGNFPDENLFAFPHLFNEIPGWEAYMDNAIEAIWGRDTKKGETLKKFKKELVSVSKGMVRQQIAGNMDLITGQIQSFKKLQAHKTNYYLIGIPRHMPLFMEYIDMISGIFDPEVDLEKGTLYNVPVVSLETVKQSSLPVICGFPTPRYKVFKDILKEIPPERRNYLQFFAGSIERNINVLLSSFDENRPCVMYGTGGMAEVLLEFYGFDKLNVVAFSDTDPKKWGKAFEGVTIIPPKEIPQYSKDVIILSDQYQLQIKKSLLSLHGETLDFHTLA